MTDNENRRLDNIELTLRNHSDTLNQTAVNVATIVEKIKHVPTWPQVEQAIERSIKPLNEDITTRIELAVSNCQVRNHKPTKSESSTAIKIDLKNASPIIKWIFIVVLPAAGYAINEISRFGS